MRQLYVIFLLLFIQPFILWSQEHPSIHQIEHEKYKELPKEPSKFDISGKSIHPLNSSKYKTPTSAVFGYFPYWKYPESIQDIQFDLLSHIALFDFSVLSGGNLSPPTMWPWTDLINAAHENGVRVILTAVNFNSAQIHQFLTDEEIKLNFFEQLKNTLLTYQLQGVNIDFENISYDDRGEMLNTFMAELKSFLQSEIPGSELSIAVPPVNWGGWQFSELADACDYMFIMGYNFYGPWSETSGACAPLTGGSYNISNSLAFSFSEVAINQPEKLILGVPYYGNRWQTEDGAAYSQVVDHTNQPTYSLAKNISDEHGELWDEVSQTTYCSYLENDNWFQVWYDSDSSLGLKYDLSESYNLKGIGMWALGYDSDKPELWNEIRKRYEETSSVLKVLAIPIKIHVSNITENRLQVKFELEQNSSLSMQFLNVSGQIVFQNNYGQMSPGQHAMEVSTGRLASGMYVLKILSLSDSEYHYGIKKVFIR